MKRRLTKKAYNKGVPIITSKHKIKFVYFGRNTKASRYLMSHIEEVRILAFKEFGDWI